MNARAPVSTPVIASTPRTEHISLESAQDVHVAAAAARKVLATYKLSSGLRGCSTEVAILDGHFLRVHSQRRRAPPRKYVFDLRFVNPKPMRIRHVAWNWMTAAGLLIAGAIGAGWQASTAAATVWTNPVFFAAVGSVLLAGVAVFFCIRRTTESLEFNSVHGGVPLVSIVGGIGSAKAGKRFFIELIKNVHAAKAARQQPPQVFLRDEMREHHRLRELNVLSEADYEASKTRILASHS